MIKAAAVAAGITSVVCATLTGCTSVPADLGRSDVAALVSDRGRNPGAPDKAGAIEREIEALSGVPLDAASAVRIALLNSPRLKAAYARLGYAAADVYAAARIRNPVFSASVLGADSAGALDKRSFGLVVSFTDMLTRPARRRLGEAGFAAAKLSVGDEILRVAADAEQALYAYAAAEQLSQLREQQTNAARLSAEFAGRFHGAGNLSDRALAEARVAVSTAHLASLDADAEAYRARTALANLLGLSAGADWRIERGLVELPSSEQELGTLLSLAVESRLDLAAARAELEVLAARHGMVSWSRWLGDIEIGYERERETDGIDLEGPTAGLELPVFNQHRDELLRANTDLSLAYLEVERVALEVENGVRFAHRVVDSARARVLEIRDNLIPARIAAVARAQEQMNFMLIGVFELIDSKQQEYEAYAGYIEALGNYWQARTALTLAVGDALPADDDPARARIDIGELLVADPASGEHSAHGLPADGGESRGARPRLHDRHSMGEHRPHADHPTHEAARPASRDTDPDHEGVSQ